MSVFASLLVLVSIAFLLAGVALRSTEAYAVAAVASAVAVILLWRHLRVNRDDTFVSDGPVATMPDWEKPLALRAADAKPRDVVEPPDVAIDDYDVLMAAEILPSLETLSIEELEAVVTREKAGLQRQGVITRAQRLIDLTRSPDVNLTDTAVVDTAAVETALDQAPKRRASRVKTKVKVAEVAEVETPKVAPKRTRRKAIEKSDPDLSI